MPYPKKATDSQLIKAYKHTKNIRKTAEIFDMCGQSVYERLIKLGVIISRRFTPNEWKFLKENYNHYVEGDGLKALSLLMGRSVTTICKKAREAGLTNIHRPKKETAKFKISEEAKKRQKLQGHPRGMLGKKHTTETKNVIGESSRNRWESLKNSVNLEEYKKMMLKRASRTGTISNPYSRCWTGWFEHNNKKYYMRSKWEYNYALYLNFLVKQRKIKAWTYEPDTFWFEKIKRGVRSYTPDFKITNLDNSIEYHEVKGWMDDKSKTKIKRMAKFYPDIKLKVMDKSNIKEIAKIKSMLKGWMEV